MSILIKIGNFVKSIFVKEKEVAKNTCSTCVHWASEEMNNVPILDNGRRFCDIHKKYTKPNHSCECYQRELFEATEDSTQTEEISIELDQELEIETENKVNEN